MFSESNFFNPRWSQAFWGANYSRLMRVKHRYDPEGLFFAHHGVGSEKWSDRRLRSRGLAQKNHQPDSKVRLVRSLEQWVVDLEQAVTPFGVPRPVGPS